MLTIPLLEETTVQPNLTRLLWVAFGFFTLMVSVGWLASRGQKPEQPAESHAPKSRQKHH